MSIKSSLEIKTNDNIVVCIRLKHFQSIKTFSINNTFSEDKHIFSGLEPFSVDKNLFQDDETGFNSFLRLFCLCKRNCR